MRLTGYTQGYTGLHRHSCITPPFSLSTTFTGGGGGGADGVGSHSDDYITERRFFAVSCDFWTVTNQLKYKFII